MKHNMTILLDFCWPWWWCCCPQRSTRDKITRPI